MVTLAVPVAVFPEESVAVKVTTVSPAGRVAGALWAIAGSASTRSSAAAAPRNVVMRESVRGSEASVVWIQRSGGSWSTGSVWSVTETTNDFVAVWPSLSVALQVTVVCPSGKVWPEAGLQLAGSWPSSPSEADTKP